MTAVDDVEVQELVARMSRLERRVDDLDEGDVMVRLGGADRAAPDDESAGDVIEPAYEDVTAWVTEHFTKVYPRPVGGEWRWCARWYEHAEALSRLEALWRSWELLRCDAGMGMATWYRDHLDPQLPILLGSRGPFALCSRERHEVLSSLATSRRAAGK